VESLTVLFFLSSGLFLGWSLGANNTSTVFGTAVSSRMVRFSTAAFICSMFVILGSVIGGAGATKGLSELGTVNALAGSFTVALAAALAVLWMTKLGLPVSITQAVVGAIIGWNWFSGSITNLGTLTKILSTWIACPILGAIFAAALYKLTILVLARVKIHILTLDSYTRWGLILAGAFASYALGANNIGNVMGVFVSACPFIDFRVADLFHLTSMQQLFLLGGIAIAVGVYTYSKRVILTVGGSLMPLNPVAACIVVIAHSLVLYMFSSSELKSFLIGHGLPPLPLIPVASSQAVVGAVIGVGLLKGIKGARQIKWGVLVEIASGWISTPIIAALMSFVMLFIMQNVFSQKVYREVYFYLSEPVLAHLQQEGIPTQTLTRLENKKIAKATNFREALREQAKLNPKWEKLVIAAAEIDEMHIDPKRLAELDRKSFKPEQIAAIKKLSGRVFQYKWQLAEALAKETKAWQLRSQGLANAIYNEKLQDQLDLVYRIFRVNREVISSGFQMNRDKKPTLIITSRFAMVNGCDSFV
jgi:PiT family inorganic phosphate transporter